MKITDIGRQEGELPRVSCPYCHAGAALVTGRRIYPLREDLWDRWFWLCAPCNAYVGAHRNSPTHEPYGRLADKRLRELKMKVHLKFDALWEVRDDGRRAPLTRRQAYKWLAGAMGLKEAHIGEFDDMQCERALVLVKRRALGIRE